ncbi:MAG: phenylalanine--tRNA ligase subunit alpha [Candidatus Omnitrophica bacterium]|nr:phenylalanine--tRNA ligase subunit alpha [Candidatus Omnitrophota bacterium]
MDWNLEETEKKALIEIKNAVDEKELEVFRIKYLGRKGVVQEIFSYLGKVPKEDKPLFGQKANSLRNNITKAIETKKQSFIEKTKDFLNLDVTLPGVAVSLGHKHLITQTIDEICSLFETLGFVIQEGPEIETEAHNFEGLNIPEDHPSRDGFDTFYLEAEDPYEKNKNLLLRSHTSPGQIRIMKEHKPPLAVVIPGRVYRPDAVDASHSFMFHQIEGLLVDKDIKFSDLKGLLTDFCQKFFGKNINMRFRPHYFPFTEPSAEVDISWKDGKKEWLEIMGCGMVHPKVFEFVGYKKGAYTGLAFGLGVERIAMLKHGVSDIRTFYENDNRFLKQF